MNQKLEAIKAHAKNAWEYEAEAHAMEGFVIKGDPNPDNTAIEQSRHAIHALASDATVAEHVVNGIEHAVYRNYYGLLSYQALQEKYTELAQQL